MGQHANLAILDCATLPATLLAAHGSVGAQVRNWLAPHMPGARFTRIAVAEGEPLPTAARFDGYLLPGSEKGVYDDAVWMEPLQGFLLLLRDAQVPLVGICFGHQLMAHTFGGRAQKMDHGMATGVRAFEVDGATLTGHVLHQDQVVERPASATVIGRAPYCANAVLRYDFPALSFQFHPEYTPAFMRDAVGVLEGDALSAAEADAARASLCAVPPADLYADEVARFFAETISVG